MQISVTRIDKTAILELTGSIDLSSSPAVREILLHELRESRTPRVILNLEKVKYIDSSGVASLVEGLRASRLDMGEVKLVDQEVVRFLGVCEARGVELSQCSPYICEWIDRERGSQGDS